MANPLLLLIKGMGNMSEKNYNMDYTHIVSRAIDRVCEARSKIIFQSDEHSLRKVSEYIMSVKSLISVLPKKHLPKNHSKKIMKIDSLYESYHYSQVVIELDKIVRKIFGKLNGDYKKLHGRMLR